jgi:predicted amidohydrolase
LRYGKLYDQPKGPMPGVFDLDGIPCGAIICADRWLRGVEEIPIQQGARISFELSCNSAVEWVAPFEWYWYVPRAVRNSVWVVFANTGNTAAGVAPYPGAELRHGHTAIVAPDGRIVASSNDDVATVVMAEIDVSEATRTEALARSGHPALHGFWEAGLMLQTGQEVAVPPFTPLKSPVAEITIAAAQVTGDVSAMEAIIREARDRKVDLIVFPARAVAETALPRLQVAARASTITVVFGAEHRGGGRTWNSAFAIGPDGILLTRYDQLSATKPYEPGTDGTAMWFRVKGIPAVVTIGGDGLWSELAELAALAGAQLHVHLEHDPTTGAAALLRRQVWANLASYQTFTATVNVIESMIWDDLRGSEERRAPIGQRQPESGAVEVYSQYSANLVARAADAGPLLVVSRRVNAANLYHTRTVARKNPQMEAWYRLGAASLQPR